MKQHVMAETHEQKCSPRESGHRKERGSTVCFKDLSPMTQALPLSQILQVPSMSRSANLRDHAFYTGTFWRVLSPFIQTQAPDLELMLLHLCLH